MKLSGRLGDSAKKSEPRLAPAAKRRSVPYAVLGGALAVVFAIGFAATSLNVGGRQSYLAVVRSVRAGQVIQSSDLAVVQVATDAGLGLIPAGQESAVTGRAASLPLAPGALLTRREVGPASFPASGQQVIAVAVKTGQYPAEMTAGAHVVVGTSPAPGATGSVSVVPLSGAPSAVVLSITPGSDSATGSVSLLTDAGSASAIAAIPSAQVQLVLTSPSGS
ncbi:hypothetical protein [Catenulispora rubra]|uniref:hypothetical protein n=1 Tax=Catenulispora rubra TaxID=280293 RepID=UPI0018921B5C|nr:hypothetical protein [Catenulispora rubra]